MEKEIPMKTAILIALALTTQAFALTPAERAIEVATAKVERQPANYPYYNELAMAYARRARETSDVQFYTKAEDTLRKSFALKADNFEGLKVQAWLELGRHEFAKARETAAKLNKISPDDVSVYGYLVDANVELGNYDEAVGAAQWMLDLRPGNTAGLVRAAYLRELHGNLSGALELMQMAYDSESLSETEDRAWLLTQMAHLEMLGGDVTKAEEFASSALGTFPGYHYALAAMAQIRTAQYRYDDAVKLLAERYQAAPHAENLYALAEAQELAGDKDGAMRSFQKFEQASRAESAMADNSNRELIFYYIDHAKDPAKGLEVARAERARRHDVFTVDAYAWALAANGDYVMADKELQKALAVGVKDPKLLSHATAIAQALRQTELAAR
jgi:tetratricopeptide (TPR) repeat protein